MAIALIVRDFKPVHISRVDKRLSVSGVYLLYLGSEVVYIGQSNSILRRIGEHIADGTKIFDHVAWLRCLEPNRCWLENRYVRHFKPLYNIEGEQAKMGLRKPAVPEDRRQRKI